MALNFKGETTTAVLNNTENVYKKDDLFRLYDAGILKLGNVVCEHGDFVSWNGTAWQLEKNAGYAVETSGASESLEERISTIELLIPAGTSESNPLMNAAETEHMILKFAPIEANTLRFDFSKKDYDPIVAAVGTTGTWKKVSEYANIWDWTREGNSFSLSFQNAFTNSDNIVSVIAAGDTSAITESTYYMFSGCTSLKSVCLFNLRNVTNFRAMFNDCSLLESVPLFDMYSNQTTRDMFNGCSSLKKVPLFDMRKVTDSYYMFNNCTKVEEGALALYQQVSTQTTPPFTHAGMFLNCGAGTVTGAAELAQIPASWGGTAT